MKSFSLSLEEYKDLCNNATDLIQSVITNGHFKYVNNSWFRVLGYTRREVTKMTIFDIIHPDEIEHCQRLFKSVMSGGDVGLVTTTFITKNGQNIIVEGNVNCNFIDGKPGYTRAVFRDITKRKQTEEILRKSEENWRSLVENAPNIIMLVDHDRNIQFINYVVPGLTVEDVVGKSIYDFIPAEFQETVKEVVDKVFQNGETAIYETMGTGPDGNMSWYETSVAPRKHDGHITGVIQITLDITDRKKAEEERERLIQELQETLTKVNTLSGLLPTCAWCKKLRDDEGYWKSVEEYISAHTGAEFTHGMCPECQKKYFAEHFTEEDSKENNNSEVR